MFMALLLTTVAGVGAANSPAPASELLVRGNSQHSYLCSCVNKKCSSPKAQASVIEYCSSLLNDTKVTKTEKVTIKTTKTDVITATAVTVNKPGGVVTSTVTACAPPQMAVVERSEPFEDTQSGEARDSLKRDAAQPKGYPGSSSVHKPSCLSSYTKSAQLTSACKCASIAPRTTTITSTVTSTAHLASTITATATITGIASTTYVLEPSETFSVLIADGESLVENYEPKALESGLAFVDTSVNTIADTILFQLNESGNLITEDGRVAGDFVDVESPSNDGDGKRVYLKTPDAGYTPLTCSLSFESSEMTCPLDCSYSSVAERNLGTRRGRGGASPWMIGEPREGQTVYRTYAVTRGGRAGGRAGSTVRGRIRRT